jgi:hypothetical protein
MFWQFDIKILPPEANANPELSDTGDVCHYNIVGVSNPRLRAVFINRALSDFSIVDGGIIRPF